MANVNGNNGKGGAVAAKGKDRKAGIEARRGKRTVTLGYDDACHVLGLGRPTIHSPFFDFVKTHCHGDPQEAAEIYRAWERLYRQIAVIEEEEA